MRYRLALPILFGLGLLTPLAAEALPLLGAKPVVRTYTAVEQVKVICDEQGRCYRPPKRRPVARWVYGDNNFSGPYTGPGDYGSPRSRYIWWPFWW